MATVNRANFKSACVGAVVMALSLGPASAWAHHSTVPFDQTKVITFEGTVKDFQWTNPHSWLQLAGKDGNGGGVEWSLEMGPSAVLRRSGWQPRSLTAGEKVTVTFNPRKDGTNGGRLISVTLPDGKVLKGQGEFTPPPQ